jgi:hypothetical protein
MADIITIANNSTRWGDAVNRNFTNINAELVTKANSSHSHQISQIQGLQATLNNKADTPHQHNVADIIGIESLMVDISSHTLRLIPQNDSPNRRALTIIADIVDREPPTEIVNIPFVKYEVECQFSARQLFGEVNEPILETFYSNKIVIEKPDHKWNGWNEGTAYLNLHVRAINLFNNRQTRDTTIRDMVVYQYNFLTLEMIIEHLGNDNNVIKAVANEVKSSVVAEVVWLKQQEQQS